MARVLLDTVAVVHGGHLQIDLELTPRTDYLEERVALFTLELDGGALGGGHFDFTSALSVDPFNFHIHVADDGGASYSFAPGEMGTVQWLYHEGTNNDTPTNEIAVGIWAGTTPITGLAVSPLFTPGTVSLWMEDGWDDLLTSGVGAIQFIPDSIGDADFWKNYVLTNEVPE